MKKVLIFTFLCCILLEFFVMAFPNGINGIMPLEVVKFLPYLLLFLALEVVEFLPYLLLFLPYLLLFLALLLFMIFVQTIFCPKYITRKILNLYKKPDGEYVIISDSIWLFWLPIFWLELWKIVGRGIKAEKIGDRIELREIKERGRGYYGYLHGFRFEFCKNSEQYNFNQFGCIKWYFNWYSYFIGYYDSIHYDIIFANHENRWLFRLTLHRFDKKRAKEEGKKILVENSLFDASYYYNAYYNAQLHSHNHLMGIYFGDIHYNEFEKIIYNIITQTDENKVIQLPDDPDESDSAKALRERDEKDDIITEYYYHYEKPYYSSYDFEYIAKITTKEGFYYLITSNRLSLEYFDIKEFMQFKGIHPRGLFTYGDKDNGALIYCLNGNYFKCIWNLKYWYPRYTKSIFLEPITLEKYLKVIEEDSKYQIACKSKKWHKIIYNILTQTNENEVIYINEAEHEEYYYKIKHPAFDDWYDSISKKTYYYTDTECYFIIKGLGFENFDIVEFMSQNGLQPNDLFFYRDDYVFCLNDNYFRFTDKYSQYKSIHIFTPEEYLKFKEVYENNGNKRSKNGKET